MNTNNEMFQRIIRTVKLAYKHKFGIELTNEEIAEKASMSNQEFTAYFMGEKEVSEDIKNRLQLIAGLRTITLTDVDFVTYKRHRNEEDNIE